MIHVVATIDLEPGARAKFLAAFHELVPTVLEEEGCIEYGPTIDMETPVERQAAVRHDTVVVIEKWEGVEDLQRHLRAPHMERYREKVKELLKATDLRILSPTSSNTSGKDEPPR